MIMNRIEIDAKNWTTLLDFYRELLTALKAPDWNGTSIQAVLDFLIWDGSLVMSD